MEEITITTPECDKNDKNALNIPSAANADYNKTIRIPKKKMVIKKKVVEQVKPPPVIHLIPGENDVRVWEGFGYLYLKHCHEECDENGNYCDCPGPVYDLKTKKKLGSYLGSPNGFSPDFDDPNWSD